MIYLTCHLESLWFSNYWQMNSAHPFCDWWTHFSDMRGKWWLLEDLPIAPRYAYFNEECAKTYTFV